MTQLPIDQPQPPDGCPPDVAAEFAKVVALLGPRAAAADGYLILMLATAWRTWRKAQGDVAKEGAVVSIGGCAAPHPALTVAAQAHGQILALTRELGFSPAARAKLKIPAAPALPKVRLHKGRG